MQGIWFKTYRVYSMCTLKTYDFSGNEVYVLTRVVNLVRHTFPETYNIRRSEVYV